MDDFLLPQTDEVDCLIEIHGLKEQAKVLDDEYLVEFVSEVSRDTEITIETELAMASFFNTGRLTRNNRKILEAYYVLLKNYLCVSEDGEICQTRMI